MNVLIAPDKTVRGISIPDTLDAGAGANGKPVQPRLWSATVADLLTQNHETDAHFVAYTVVGPDGEVLDRASRLLKQSLPRIRALGGEVLCGMVTIDLDLKHMLKSDKEVAWTDLPDPEGTWAAACATKLDVGPWTVAYATKHGFRFIHVLALPVPAGPGFEALVASVIDSYWRAGLPADRACSDWTRLFRAPRVTRESGEQTWLAPWYRVVDHLGDDTCYQVPDEKYLTPWPEAERKVEARRSQADRPDDDAAHAMVEVLGDDGKWKYTPDAERARQRLLSSAVYPYIFNAGFGKAALADPGSRHQKLTQLAGIVVGELRQWATPELAYALVREATKMLDDDEDWPSKAWEMVTSFWAREKVEPAAAAAGPMVIDALPEQPDGGADEEQAPDLPDDGGDDGDLACNDEGKPYSIPRNVRVALRLLGARVEYDEFSERMTLSGMPGFGPLLDDKAMRRLWLRCQEELRLGMAKETFWDVVQDAALRRRRHPVREYLNGLQWDGVRRIENWLCRYLGAEDSEYTRAVGRLFLVAAVRRVRQPGTKFDEMLILEGPQGAFKSTAMQIIAVNSDWFSDSLPLGAEAREAVEQTGGKWIVEASDLHGRKRSDVEELKAFLSRRTDRARMAYARMPEERPRQFVVVGTTNSDRYLEDDTGNRRFWPVRVGDVDLTALAADRDQIWAEAALYEAEGVPTRLDPELYPAAQEHQEDRRVEDPYEDVFREVLGENIGILRTLDAAEIIGIARKDLNPNMTKRISRSLLKLGWRRKRVRVGNDLQYVYVRGAPEMEWADLTPANLKTLRLKRISERRVEVRGD